MDKRTIYTFLLLFASLVYMVIILVVSTWFILFLVHHSVAYYIPLVIVFNMIMYKFEFYLGVECQMWIDRHCKNIIINQIIIQRDAPKET
jgi:hypothetical protein